MILFHHENVYKYVCMYFEKRLDSRITRIEDIYGALEAFSCWGKRSLDKAIRYFVSLRARFSITSSLVSF